MNKDGNVAFKRKEEDKVLYKYNLVVLPHLYQTELLFRSRDQMGHQGVDKVYNRIQKQFEWPGLKKACENKRTIKRGKDVSESEVPAVGFLKGSMK